MTDTELADHVEAISAFQEHVESRATLLIAAARLREQSPTPSVRARALEEALRLCAARFRYYADLHSAKHTPDGDNKANSNHQMAEMCERALAEGEG